jgi:hypothetical protein
VARNQWSSGNLKAGFRLFPVVVILGFPLLSCQMGQSKKNVTGDQAAALASMLKRNQAITELIPSLSEWVHSDSLEGKQLRKPYPSLEEFGQKIGAPNNTDSLARPGKPAELLTARWYYGQGTDKADLGLEAEFLKEGETWRLNGISFWQGKDYSANTMEYIGRDVMYWKGTRYPKR